LDLKKGLGFAPQKISVFLKKTVAEAAILLE